MRSKEAAPERPIERSSPYPAEGLGGPERYRICVGLAPSSSRPRAPALRRARRHERPKAENPSARLRLPAAQVMSGMLTRIEQKRRLQHSHAG